MRIYLSGVCDSSQALAAVKQGVSAVGIKIGYGMGDVHPETAREIFFDIPMFVSRVGIFANEKRYHIQELTTFCRLDTLHFIGSEEPKDLERYHEHIIKSFSVHSLNRAGLYPGEAVEVILPNIECLAGFVSPSGKLLVLTGDLLPEQWIYAVEKLQPFAVHLTVSELNGDLIPTLSQM